VPANPQNNSVIFRWDGAGGHLHYISTPETVDQELLQIKSFFMQKLGIEKC
jgi:hypothetical protein